MSATSVLLACCLVASTAASAPSAGSAFDATALLGVWELSGVGDQHNLTAPQRMVLAFDPAGGFQMSVWERGEGVPQEVTGRYTIRGDQLELTIRGSDRSEEFRVAWSPSILVLQPVDPLGRRPGLPLHFEKRPWISP